MSDEAVTWKVWGSSYLLQDVEPIRLVATLGSSTRRDASGSVRVSFTQEPGVFATIHGGSKNEIIMKWDVGLRLMAMVHVLVLQNKLIRDETPTLTATSSKARIFTIGGGLRSSPLVCSWDPVSTGVHCRPVEGTTDQFELVLEEDAAVELVMGLAERIALNGTMSTRKGSDPK